MHCMCMAKHIRHGGRVRMVRPTEYKYLHAKEVAKLETAGYKMSNNFEDLMQCVRSTGSEREPFGDYFADGYSLMLDILDELCRKHVYTYDPDRYSVCRKKLDDGLKLLCNAEKSFTSFTYSRLKDLAERCQSSETAYATAWSDILEFDRKNKNPNMLRRGGWHAFNQQKADMSRGAEIAHMHELLADLNDVGRRG
jgi:hypothetical protein